MQVERPRASGDLSATAARRPASWTRARLDRVREHRERTRAAGTATWRSRRARPASLGSWAMATKRRAGHRRGDERVEAQGDDEVVPGERRRGVGEAARRFDDLDVVGQERRARSRGQLDVVAPPAPTCHGCSCTDQRSTSGASAAARLPDELAVAGEVAERDGDRRRRAGPQRSSTPAGSSSCSTHAGSAPIQNGAGAPAAASTAADSSSRRTSRSVWRTSHRASVHAARPRRSSAPTPTIATWVRRGHVAPATSAAALRSRLVGAAAGRRVQRLEHRAAADDQRRRTCSARARRGERRAPARPARRGGAAVSAGIAARDDDVVVGERRAERRAERFVAGITLPEGADEQ